MSNAPKVTEADIEARIVSTEFHILPGTTNTVCVLHLDNGWSETGISACVSPENFNETEGQKWARLQAFNKLWPLLGFELKTKLALIAKAGQPSGKILELGSPVTYVGTKVVHMVAMDRQTYNDYRGWKLPDNENGEDNGYLVEYTDGGAPNVEGHPGYVSWSPVGVAAKAYNVGVRQEPSTFISRLCKERDDLVLKLDSLNSFLISDKAKTVPAEHIELLQLQAKAMTDYAFIISKRYDDLTAE